MTPLRTPIFDFAIFNFRSYDSDDDSGASQKTSLVASRLNFQAFSKKLISNYRKNDNSCVTGFSTNTKRPFNGNMDNFKFNFLSRGQRESLNLDKFFLSLFKTSPCDEVFMVF